jgi:hypothetical protein
VTATPTPASLDDGPPLRKLSQRLTQEAIAELVEAYVETEPKGRSGRLYNEPERERDQKESPGKSTVGNLPQKIRLVGAQTEHQLGGSTG